MFGPVSRRSAALGVFGRRRPGDWSWRVAAAAPAWADEKLTYLFPAPPLLPAFGPIQLAKGKGYFSQAGWT